MSICCYSNSQTITLPGCSPEPTPSSSPQPTSTPTPTPTSPSPSSIISTPTPTPTPSPEPDCYKIDYIWNIFECATYTGSLLFRNGSIICYTGNDIVSVETGVGSFNSKLNFGDTCSLTPTINCNLDFSCNGYVIIDVPPGGNIMTLGDGNICDGSLTGTFYENFVEHELTVTISFNNTGSCDCSGYTPVI